ncbi:UvrD-helicase domain-containing protein [Thermus tenuipuniceus]|uniref:UvrD-helicase domain-containing protein n=1 Tax=Thermus tenuipuniceus TaxID=2078690 RepID=UPI000CF96CF3|nr:UvrD-helicase domain-containing protein [Thermus tenuipuniceus]
MPDTTFTATPEQEAAVEAFLEGKDLKLVAVAGSGKTTTLRLMAEAAPKRRLLYLAFNRAIRDEARGKMPPNTQVHTLHSLVFGEMVRSDPGFAAKFEAGKGQVRAYHIREALGLDVVEAYVVKATLENFLRSNLARPHPSMVPPPYREALRRKTWGNHGEILEAIVGSVKTLWDRMRDPEDPFPLSHDGYVKLWAANGGSFPPVEGLLVDEAQDLNPVFIGVLESKTGMQRVYVGDPAQQIYAWRGAVNAMAVLGGEERRLSWSFRFGPELAALVRGFMGRVGRDLALEGRAPWPTRVAPFSSSAPVGLPAAVLCRTNAGVVQAALSLGVQRFHIQGGVEETVHLLQDAEALRRGAPRPNPHPDLLLLESWDDLEALAEELKDPTAGILVRLAQHYKDLGLLADYLHRAHVANPKAAPLVLSTAHKAKGKEWHRVVLWDDFPTVWRREEREGLLARGLDLHEEENLLYVAMTRAMEGLHLRPPLDELLEASSLVLPGAEEAPPPSPGSLLGRILLFLDALGSREDLPEEVRREALSLSQEALERLSS